MGNNNNMGNNTHSTVCHQLSWRHHQYQNRNPVKPEPHLRRQGGREGRREGRRERGREGGEREGGRREGGKEGGKEGEREGGRLMQAK